MRPSIPGTGGTRAQRAEESAAAEGAAAASSGGEEKGVDLSAVSFGVAAVVPPTQTEGRELLEFAAWGPSL